MISVNYPTSSPIHFIVSPFSTRLRKRSSLGQQLSPSNRLSGGGYTTASMHSERLQEESNSTDLSPSQDPRRSPSPGSFAALEFKGSGTAKSSWLKRMSTLSSLKTGSHDSTPTPDSPSLSYSNGSTAFILPSAADEGPTYSPRNKLVKRSASQKGLQDTNTPHSSLRRPATSHQRTATFQQRYSSGGELNYRPKFAPFTPFDDLPEDHQADDESLQTWLPFFTSRAPTPAKDGMTRRRNSSVPTNRKEPVVGSLIPSVNDLPTLLLATSITSNLHNNVPDNVGSRSRLSNRRRPSTAVGIETFIPPSTPDIELDLNNTRDLRSRRSFSIADMFPSPSPSRWRVSRSNSLKRHNGPPNVSSSRRVSSAPLSGSSQPPLESASVKSSNSDPLKPRTSGQSLGHGSETTSGPLNTFIDPTSPLPPLNRLSTFEVELPITTPSYPTSPHLGISSSSPKISTAPSPSMSSPFGLAIARNKSHRPSGALSDRTSTLLGSDNDNSRFLSSDEDEFDFRSDTVYDSTRTGATGSSHSGVRRPPIETIFDESSTTESPKHKLFALQDLLTTDSFVEPASDRQRNAETDQSLSTPVRVASPFKEDEYPAPIHATNMLSLAEFPSSPPEIPSKAASVQQGMDGFQDDEDWSFDKVEDAEAVLPVYDLTPHNGQSSPAGAFPRFLLGLPSAASSAVESSPKSNIFEWSEQSAAEKESLQGSSPRPKTVHGIKTKDARGSRLTGRRGSSALHLRSQSVPAPQDGSGHRSHNATSKLESWVLGNKGVSEDWDGDFDFEDSHRSVKQTAPANESVRTSLSSGMLVPQAILERQASVHGQFGQVKELTLLVEELKRLRQQASAQGIMQGQSAVLWKEAEGIINLATLDDEDEEFLPPRSPHAAMSEFDLFDEGSPSHGRRESVYPSPREDRWTNGDDLPSFQQFPRSPSDKSKPENPPTSRPRKESAAKAKSVLETIHQQRSDHDSTFIAAKSSQAKLPFDTTSLRDLVTRAGVVTRALKEIVRRAENPENSPSASKFRPATPPDPLFSQIFQHHPSSPSIPKTPRVAQTSKGSNFRGGAIVGNDNEINGHMKMMTVV